VCAYAIDPVNHLHQDNQSPPTNARETSRFYAALALWHIQRISRDPGE
jgi:hypothetical protein